MSPGTDLQELGLGPRFSSYQKVKHEHRRKKIYERPQGKRWEFCVATCNKLPYSSHLIGSSRNSLSRRRAPALRQHTAYQTSTPLLDHKHKASPKLTRFLVLNHSLGVATLSNPGRLQTSPPLGSWSPVHQGIAKHLDPSEPELPSCRSGAVWLDIRFYCRNKFVNNSGDNIEDILGTANTVAGSSPDTPGRTARCDSTSSFASSNYWPSSDHTCPYETLNPCCKQRR